MTYVVTSIPVFPPPAFRERRKLYLRSRCKVLKLVPDKSLKVRMNRGNLHTFGACRST
jgi:hypothetical protein